MFKKLHGSSMVFYEYRIAQYCIQWTSEFRKMNTYQHRVYTSPLIFACCRDSPSYVAYAETIHDLLLPAENVVPNKWLPAETVRVIQPPAKTLGRKQNHMDSLCRKPFFVDGSLSRKQEIANSLGRSQI